MSRPGGNGEAGQVSRRRRFPKWLGLWKVGRSAEAEPGGSERWTCVEQSNH